MNLEIQTRKSVRKYKINNVSKEHLELINNIIAETTSLNNIEIDCILIENGAVITDTFKGIISKYTKVIAPHYLVFTSEKKEGHLENIGFIGEQIVLKMIALGIGTCWIGGINKNLLIEKVKIKDNHVYVIVIAFGYPIEALSIVNKRNRINLEKIVTGNIHDSLKTTLEALHVAPSTINSQPWRIVANDLVWDMYLESKNMITKKIIFDKNKIDIGIGLSHIFITAKENKYTVEFNNKSKANIKNKEYITTITFN